MIRTEIETVVARPADAVFSHLADFSKNPTWQQGMRSCEWVTPPPLRVGSRYEQVAEFLGREIRSTFEVTEYEPGRRVAAHTIAGSLPISFSRSVTAQGPETTLVRAEIVGDARGVFRLFEFLLAPMVRRSIRADYARLKQLLENR